MSERAKGARGEREVVALLREYGLPADRTVHNSGLYLRGDLTGVAGYHIEVKRQETLRLPAWIRQATREAPQGAVPLVCFRQNLGDWYAALPLRDLARLLTTALIADEALGGDV